MVMKKIILLAVGFGCMIGGIALVLFWWPYVVALFKGGVGMALAFAGLLILASVK